MARKRIAKIQAPAKDFFADECASKTVRWFWPADFDVSDEAPEWLRIDSTGWFFRDAASIWQGPFLTSTEAATAEVASFQKAA